MSGKPSNIKDLKLTRIKEGARARARAGAGAGAGAGGGSGAGSGGGVCAVANIANEAPENNGVREFLSLREALLEFKNVLHPEKRFGVAYTKDDICKFIGKNAKTESDLKLCSHSLNNFEKKILIEKLVEYKRFLNSRNDSKKEISTEKLVEYKVCSNLIFVLINSMPDYIYNPGRDVAHREQSTIIMKVLVSQIRSVDDCERLLVGLENPQLDELIKIGGRVNNSVFLDKVIEHKGKGQGKVDGRDTSMAFATHDDVSYSAPTLTKGA